MLILALIFLATIQDAAQLMSAGKYVEAKPLFRRSLSIFEKVLGKGHPSTETVRANYASLQEEMQQKGKG